LHSLQWDKLASEVAKYSLLFILSAGMSPLLGDVDFASSIHPILSGRCAPCHSGDHPQAGLSIESREALVKGGSHGAALVPGKPEDSLLLKRVTSVVGPQMPPGGAKLSEAQIASLRDWIAEGAPWTDTSAKPLSTALPSVKPRMPEVPAGQFDNPIDKFINAYFEKHHAPFPTPVSDALFLRRITLDVWGITPSPEQTRVFVADTRSDKRQQMVDTLLADSTRYAENWISFWNDILRNDQGVNYAGTRKSITPWLLKSLEDNMPFDKMAYALLSPETPDDPDGFLTGVNWRGDINASQTPFMQAAQNSAQVFLGVNLKCASCHDSFINRYKLKQSYSLAAMFSDESSLELVRCDNKTGVRTGPRFLFPEVSFQPASDSLTDRRRAAAKSFTNPENGRFSRTIVNRYWQREFGRGLEANVDEMDAEPWNPDLLDWLASDFAQHNYDLKRLLRMILTSRAYGLPAIVETDPLRGDYVFSGPILRRITAEEFADSLSEMTGEWRVMQSGEKATYSREWQVKSTPTTRALGRPIRDQVFTTREDAATTLQALELVNGETLAAVLRRGAMRLLGELPPAPQNLFDSGRISKGQKLLDIDLNGAKQLWLLADDAGCYDPGRTVAGWAELEATGPKGTVKIADLTTLAKPEKRALKFDGAAAYQNGLVFPVGTLVMYPIEGLGLTHLKGAVGVDDGARSSDINPSVRFFIFTDKPDRDRLLRVSGEAPTAAPPASRDANALINRLFWAALSRGPNQQEALVAKELLEPKGTLTTGGLEDFLWTLVMHPEFQFIR
jgi:Protein of unknown function (DUF1549)/Protein of unknown function (DUF1553)/Planctomycete cytochrome C